MSGVAGQGRKFDINAALDAATLVFWDHGYEGASLVDLTRAMGINPPSLYKAFGSKEELFFRAVERYNATHGGFMAAAFAEETYGVELLRRILFEAADHYASPDFPGGCLVISAAVTTTAANHHVSERLAQMRTANIQEMARALDHDRGLGRIARNADTAAIAQFVGATLQGMSQQARDGASAQDLRAIADLAATVLDRISIPALAQAAERGVE